MNNKLLPRLCGIAAMAVLGLGTQLAMAADYSVTAFAKNLQTGANIISTTNINKVGGNCFTFPISMTVAPGASMQVGFDVAAAGSIDLTTVKVLANHPNGCSIPLATQPDLPASTLTYSCVASGGANCTSNLTTSPSADAYQTTQFTAAGKLTFTSPTFVVPSNAVCGSRYYLQYAAFFNDSNNNFANGQAQIVLIIDGPGCPSVAIHDPKMESSAGSSKFQQKSAMTVAPGASAKISFRASGSAISKKDMFVSPQLGVPFFNALAATKNVPSSLLTPSQPSLTLKCVASAGSACNDMTLSLSSSNNMPPITLSPTGTAVWSGVVSVPNDKRYCGNTFVQQVSLSDNLDTNPSNNVATISVKVGGSKCWIAEIPPFER